MIPVYPLSQMEADCRQRTKLWEQYRTALKEYTDSIKALDSPEAAQLGHAYEDARHARSEFDRLRDEYQRHVAEHGCGDVSGADEPQ